MIKSFKHKGLEKFFTKENTAGIQPAHATRISDCLTFLNAAQTPDDMNKPGYRLHLLKDDKEGLWAINVSGNWRIVFQFENGNAYIVNYENYH